MDLIFKKVLSARLMSKTACRLSNSIWLYLIYSPIDQVISFSHLSLYSLPSQFALLQFLITTPVLFFPFPIAHRVSHQEDIRLKTNLGMLLNGQTSTFNENRNLDI